MKLKLVENSLVMCENITQYLEHYGIEQKRVEETIFNWKGHSTLTLSNSLTTSELTKSSACY